MAANVKEIQVQAALNAAEVARRQGRYQEGINLLLDVLDYQIHVDTIYYRLGNLYFDDGDFSRAEFCYRRAIETNPNHANAHHNLGVVYKKANRVVESVRMQKKAARLEMMATGTGRSGLRAGVEAASNLQQLEEPAGEVSPWVADPQGFRRFGKRVALIGLATLASVAFVYIALLYLIGRFLF